MIASDFSSFLVQAQASKAKILALATSGDDKWARRYFEKMKKMPSSLQAANCWGLAADSARQGGATTYRVEVVMEIGMELVDAQPGFPDHGAPPFQVRLGECQKFRRAKLEHGRTLPNDEFLHFRQG